MSQINKRTIFLKDNRGFVRCTIVLSETISGVFAKVNPYAGFGNATIVFEGNSAPLTLISSCDFKKEYKTESSKIGTDISAVLFLNDSNVEQIIAYGYLGKENIKAQTLVKHAKTKMIGAQIVTAKQESIQEEVQTEAKHNQEGKIYEEVYKKLKDDPYIVEDTALSDIDIIADENYYESEKERTTEAYEKEMTVKGMEISKKQGKEEGTNMDYYNKVKDRISKLLLENEKDEILCNIIPQSSFVKIYYAEDKFYCVGLVKTEGLPSYICYGVPKKSNEPSPQEFKGISKWIPVNINNPNGEGYYMLFQNVNDGSYVSSEE